ncbi:MAG: TonB-dependent receptor [Candidatus Omnitrophica bacterium]|nr:TonB-dependent receptor [Candidatus Omnitrophota bacterium]
MRKIVLVLAVAVFLAGSAFAEEKSDSLKRALEASLAPVEAVAGSITELERIIVTPSRFEEKLGSSSCSVSVIDSAVFNREKIDTAKEALKGEPGIDIRQSGAFQGTTSLYMRGGSTGHTLILVDGMKAYDPISPNASYNLAHLTLDNVDRIEVLRGPQSALYGSDAMAGVVNIVSKKAEDTHANISWEGGSFYTYQEQFDIGSVTHGLHYNIAGSRLDTKGISQAQAKQNNQERDPYDRTSIAARVDYDVTDAITLGTTFRHTKAHFALDHGADADDDNAFSIFREYFTSIYADQKMFEWWAHSIKLGWMETMRQYFDDDSPGFDFDRSKYFGKYFKLDYQTSFNIMDVDKFLIGYEFTQETAEYYSQNDYSGFMANDIMPKVFSREGDLYLENRLNVSDRLTSTQGMRVSHHSRAGTHLTYRLDGSYLFPTGTKVRGLAATGFKAPSLYQLFAPANFYFGGGNPDLAPEKSASYEYGIDQYLFGDKVIAGVTYFHTLYTNLIYALTNPSTYYTGQYINVGKAKVYGIEASLSAKPAESVRVRSGLTYQKTKDFQNDQDLIRRPERKFFIECYWQATEKLSFDLRVRYNGPMSNNTSNPLWGSNSYKVKEYTVVDMVVDYALTKNFSVYVKMNNLFNKYYEDVHGYTTSPFAAYGGVKAKF